MDAWKEDFREPTEDERSARRALAVAIAFINAHRPLPSQKVQREFYPGTSGPTFRKLFQRDRERLAIAGLVIAEAGKDADGLLWQADADASFVRENLISQDDALTLDFLLLPLAADPSYPYARDLRLALAKIDRAYDGSSDAAIPPEARQRNKSISRLEDCMTAGHAARIAYERADGTKTTRTVAPYGFFALNGATYMVAARLDGDDQGAARPHTYNLDRVSSVTEQAKTTFERPLDFDIRDFQKYPFQMGPAIYEARFALAGGSELSAEVHNEDVAATWAIAKGACPVEPLSLVECWRKRLRTMAEGNFPTAHSPVPASKRSKTRRKSQRSGRRTATDRIRELVALLGSLSKTGDVVTLDAISTRLGVSTDEAADLMNIVCEASGEEISGLLISSSDDGTAFRLQYPGTRGRPVRLTEAETIAVVHALDYAGVTEDDPLRDRLRIALWSPKVRESEVRQALGDPSARQDALRLCAQALVENRALEFYYQGLRDDEPRARQACIRNFDNKGGVWYVRAYDIDLGQDRTFRIDRMSRVYLAEPFLAPRTPEDAGTAQRVCITFTDRAYYTMFDWPGLRVVRSTPAQLVCDLPYYGERSTWLLRRICAGNGCIIADDEGIMAAARDYARALTQRH